MNTPTNEVAGVSKTKQGFKTPEFEGIKTTTIYDGSIHIQVKGAVRLWLIKRWVKHPKIVFERSK